MKTIGNIIWLIFGGLLTAVEYILASLVMMITIIGIPFGLQTLKLGILALWPFGKTVTDSGSSSGCLCLLMNIIWIFIGGFDAFRKKHSITQRTAPAIRGSFFVLLFSLPAS